MARIATTISYKGPFFERDVNKTLAENVRLMMEGIAREGEEDVKAQLEATAANRAPLSIGGRVSERIEGRIHSLANAPWWQNAVISPSRSGLGAREAIALYAGASRVEGETGIIKRTTTRLRRAKAVQLAELTRGLD